MAPWQWQHTQNANVYLLNPIKIASLDNNFLWLCEGTLKRIQIQFQQQCAVQIQIASFVLLTIFMRCSVTKGRAWLKFCMYSSLEILFPQYKETET